MSWVSSFIRKLPGNFKAVLENEEEISQFSGKYVQDIQQLKRTTKNNFIQGNQILNQAIQYVLEKTA